jgi:hypothetical protein
MARRRCTQGQQGPCVKDGGVRGNNQDLGLSLWWKNKSSPRLLPMSAAAGLGDQEGKEGGSSLFILRERGQYGLEGGVTPRIGLGRGGAWAFMVCFPPLLLAWPSKRQPLLGGRLG